MDKDLNMNEYGTGYGPGYGQIRNWIWTDIELDTDEYETEYRN